MALDHQIKDESSGDETNFTKTEEPVIFLNDIKREK